MRTHATAIRTTGASGSGGSCQANGDGDELASMRTHATAIRTTGASGSGDCLGVQEGPEQSLGNDSIMGDYWLPWHIDSQFITLLTGDEYYNETTGCTVETSVDRRSTGLKVMNEAGNVIAVAPYLSDDVMLVQMGGFAQIYSGGLLNACRHAVSRQSVTSRIARATYCNFWYAPWDLICSLPPGTGREVAVNKGWNALMDDSYVDISMMLSFYRFREFFSKIPVGVERNTLSSLYSQVTSLLPSPNIIQIRSDIQTTNMLIVDILSDIRCPYSYVALCRLMLATERLQIANKICFRHFPVFLNPNVPVDGEDIEVYLQREHQMSKDYFYSNKNPLMIAAKMVGICFHKSRRIVNSMNAHAAVKAASETCFLKGHRVFMALSKQYFEKCLDISKVENVIKVAKGVEVSMNSSQLKSALSEVQQEYVTLKKSVEKVPCIVLRKNDVSGEGIIFDEPQSIETYKKHISALYQLNRSDCNNYNNMFPSAGVVIHSADSVLVRIPHADPRSPVTLHIKARHGFYPSEWPYVSADFLRSDERSDELKYANPRFVNHMDDSALSALSHMYKCLIESLLKSTVHRDGDRALTLLDTCGSWNTYYPEGLLPKNTKIIVQGLNSAELAANPLATDVIIQDLNHNGIFPLPSESIDFISNVASIEYMTNPVGLLSEIHRLLRPGGIVVISFSNRCFDDKAVAIWLRRVAVGAGLVDLIVNWLHFAAPTDKPWKHISSLDLTPKTQSGSIVSDPLYTLVAIK